MSRIRARLSEERGWGLVSSVLVVGILLSLALPLLSLVDTQQLQSAQERKSESSFNLSEAALDAEVFVLGKDWPTTATGAYPAACTVASASLNCPSPELLTRTYTGGDYVNRNWTVQVRDDTGTEYYDPAVIANRPAWDSNDNAKLWVRADARASTGVRTVVALVKRVEKVESFPRNAITSGWFGTSNNGNKVIVDTQGDTAQPAPLAVRCTAPPPSAGCLDYETDKGQVSPNTAAPGFANPTAVHPDVLERLRQTARSLDSYYPTGCPASPAGRMIFVESGDCSYVGGGSANSAAAPGAFVVARGTLSFGGGVSYYGLVYAANLQGSPGVVVSTHGSATIFGAVAVDAGGGVMVGSSGNNLVYDDGVFPSFKTFSGAVPIQGSWRELPAS
jgi:type II secretory pathway pseudopilin PulG